jgi:hypothetical protein
MISVDEPLKKTLLIIGVGFVLGCHLGSYFLSGVVVLGMVVALAHFSKD